jgi:sugar/nucleoside kinase (ribokinase family)
VVGNPGLDTLVLVDEDDLDLHADGYFVHNVDTIGHAPAFVARGLARLGHDVRLLGAVGDDEIGRMVTSVLAADGVETGPLFTDPTGTPRSVNFVFPDGRRTFFYDGGSHMTLQPPSELVERALSDADLVVSSLPNWGRHVLASARRRGIPIAVDLQDVRTADDPYREDFVRAADYLFASAAHLSDPEAAAARWLATGSAHSVVLGQGAGGALLVERTPEGPRARQQPPPDRSHVDGLALIDTTGAGDSLAIGYLDGIMAQHTLPWRALLRGQALARIVSSGLGGAAPFDRATLDALVTWISPE